MKCWSRSTLGVIIGIVSILLYIMIAVVMMGMMQLIKKKLNDDHQNVFESKDEAAEFGTLLLSTVLAVCLAMIVVSGVLIMGIVKRRHVLMLPWLVLSGVGFLCDGGRVVINLILGLVSSVSISTVLVSFVGGVLGIGIQALILWPIYTLWRDIRLKNDERSGRVIGGVEYNANPGTAPPEYTYYSPLPEKSSK